jgi:TPR repeat protein
MGDRAMQAKDYPSAIYWYTRAERLIDPNAQADGHIVLGGKIYAAYTAFCRWEFDDDRLWGWFAANDINLLKLKGGVLTLGVSGSNPHLEIQKLRLAPWCDYQFQVRMRCQSGKQAQLFWAAGIDIYRPQYQSKVSLDCSGAWREYRFSLTGLPDELGKFRFIPTDSIGPVDIDWIRITPLP